MKIAQKIKDMVKRVEVLEEVEEKPKPKLGKQAQHEADVNEALAYLQRIYKDVDIIAFISLLAYASIMAFLVASSFS